MILYIGTKSENTLSKGVYAAEFNENTGELSLIGSVDNKNNPMYLCLDGDRLYSADHPEDEGGVSVYEFDGNMPRLVETVWAHQDKTCYVLAHGAHILLANYGSGSISLYSRKDGQVRFINNIPFEGSGPHPDQIHSRIHCIRENGLGGMFACDLGADSMYLLEMDGDEVKVLDTLKTEPGTGPRHMAVDAKKQRVYVLGELKNILTVADYTKNTVTKIAQIPIYDRETASSGSEILLDKDAKYLYTANRADNTISVFSLESGIPVLRNRISCGGVHPRHMAYIAGRYILVSNMHSDNIAVFECVEDSLVQRFDLPIYGPSCVIEGRN